jgi:hypothetical protein
MKDSVNNEAGGSYSNHCAINGKWLSMEKVRRKNSNRDRQPHGFEPGTPTLNKGRLQ